MIEVLAAAVTGARSAYEATSFLDAEGAPPNAGQLMIMIDAEAFSSAATARIDEIAERISDVGARLPGAGRIAKRQQVERDGLTVSQQVLDTLDKLAATPI